MKQPNAYPASPRNYKSFRTTDGLLICRWCNRFGDFARAWQTNFTPPKAPTHQQNLRYICIPHNTSQYPQLSYIPNQRSQHAPYKANNRRHDTMEYPYPQDAIYTNHSQKPPFSSAHQANNKYQARRSNIPGQHKNYSNVIKNHALQDRQCFLSGYLDKNSITILIDTGSSISLLDKQLYYWLSWVLPLQPIPFSVSGANDKPLIAQGKTLISIAIDDGVFHVQLVVTRNIPFPVASGNEFLQTHGRVISFPTNHLYPTKPSPQTTDPPINTNPAYNTNTPAMNTPNASHPHLRTSVQPDQPYHIINNEPVTMPPGTNTILAIPCTLPSSGNYIFKPSEQYFVEQQFITHSS